MANEIVTLIFHEKTIDITETRAGRLTFQAPGLDIYCVGLSGDTRWAQACVIAQNLAHERHIPKTSVRNVIARPSRWQPVNPKQRKMW